MPVPKRKTARTKRNMRRSHHALKAPVLTECSETGMPKRPHRVSKAGFYKGRRVTAGSED